MRPIVKLLIVLAVSASMTTMTHSFDSGSTGADGDFDLTGTPGGTIVDFDPSALGFDLDLDGIYNFVNVVVPTDVTVRFRSDFSGSAPIVWLASGSVQIEGTLDLQGDSGSTSSGGLPATPGPGGFHGGIGTVSPNASQPGFGPGGGPAIGGNSHGTGASHATLGRNQSGSGVGTTYGNAFLFPLIGGSGASGGVGGATSVGGGGGAGGGAILIASNGAIVVNGTIDASGGDGGQADRDGGGGSGGAIRLVAPSISGSGSLLAGGGFGIDGFAGQGGLGRVRLEAHQISGLSGIEGVSRSGGLAPNTPLLPSSAPLLRIVDIAGVTVSTRPTGSFASVDVTINEPMSTTIQVDGSSIPSGTDVKITIWNETDGFQVVMSTLTGTFESSSTTANVTFSAGFSRVFTRAIWTP